MLALLPSSVLAVKAHSREGISGEFSQAPDPRKDEGEREVKNYLTTKHHILTYPAPCVSRGFIKGVEHEKG